MEYTIQKWTLPRIQFGRTSGRKLREPQQGNSERIYSVATILLLSIRITFTYICQGPICNLQPVLKPGSKLPSHPASFEAGYSFYTINIHVHVRYEILCSPFAINNSETTVYTISFIINVANCSRTINA